MKNSKGFAHLQLILVVVLLAVIGLIGWRVYENQHKTNSSASTTTSTTNASSILDSSSKSLDNEPVNSSLNSNQLNNDISSLL